MLLHRLSCGRQLHGPASKFVNPMNGQPPDTKLSMSTRLKAIRNVCAIGYMKTTPKNSTPGIANTIAARRLERERWVDLLMV